MKKLVLLSYILCGFTFLSCSKFLEENPRDQISEEEAYDNATSVYLNTVATLYNYVGGYSDSQGLQGTYRGVYDLNTFTTDEAILPTRGGDWYDGGFWQGLFLHKWGVSSDAIRATWEYLYKVIVLSNKSLERLDEFYKQTNNRYIPAYMAEVRAFRAMYYYYLVDMFGRVPLVLSSSTPMKDVKQSTRQEVFELVVKELQEAAPLLSAERSNQLGDYYGRLTRPVAYFLLAKLALNAEVYTNNNWTAGSQPGGKSVFFEVGGQRLNAWETVIAYCDSITALGYQLSRTYDENFSVFNETSVENIFTIPMDKNFYTNQMQYLFRSRHYNHAKAYAAYHYEHIRCDVDLRFYAARTRRTLPLFSGGRSFGRIVGDFRAARPAGRSAAGRLFERSPRLRTVVAAALGIYLVPSCLAGGAGSLYAGAESAVLLRLNGAQGPAVRFPL